MSTNAGPETFDEVRQAYSESTPARERLGMLFDPDTFVELDRFSTVEDEPCGVVCGYGSVGGSPACAFAQEGGGFGMAQAAKISKLYDLALKTGIPVVGVYDCGGGRVSEGIAALEAYGQLLLRINNLSGVVPQVALVLGSCTGATAMLACSADFVVMEKDATFFMTPPVLSQDKAEAAGTAQAAAKAGVAHILAETPGEACESVRKMLSYLPANNLSTSPALPHTPPEGELAPGDYAEAEPVSLAGAIFDTGSLLELLPEFGTNSYTALATLGGIPVGIAGTKNKLGADDCAKLAKLVMVCDAFQIPVVTLVNAAGFEPSSQAELCGAVREMAKLGHVYAEATTAKAAVITGKAYGGVYIALASRASNSDYTIAWPQTAISALDPQTAVAFLHADEITAQRSRQEILNDYLAQVASPLAGAKAGYLDDVIPPELTRAALISALDLLSAKRVHKNPKKHGNIPL
ncbi:MAG: carboxyl transferase [Oscillospiraceae bacterium]|nr:carboxyl transferase [Oscillospiraceae bacterium]